MKGEEAKGRRCPCFFFVTGRALVARFACSCWSSREGPSRLRCSCGSFFLAPIQKEIGRLVSGLISPAAHPSVDIWRRAAGHCCASPNRSPFDQWTACPSFASCSSSLDLQHRSSTPLPALCSSSSLRFRVGHTFTPRETFLSFRSLTTHSLLDHSPATQPHGQITRAPVLDPAISHSCTAALGSSEHPPLSSLPQASTTVPKTTTARLTPERTLPVSERS